MSDIFTKDDAQKLLADKHIMFFGDSNVRALYKDLLCLLNRNTLITDAKLKMKLEKSHEGDKLMQRSELNKGRDFVEVRKYQKNGIHIDFQFITRCYNKEIEKIMAKIKTKKMKAPSVIVMNSLLWDISRWGPNGVTEYKDNMVKLLKLFKSSLPKETLVIWTTGLPLSKSCYGGFLIKQVEFLKHTLRFEVMEANLFARQEVVSYGFDILDMHYHLRMQIHRRTKDGIHWSPLPMRHMTNLLLTHIALSWDSPLPGNFVSPTLKCLQGEVKHDEKVVLPTIPPSLNDVTVSPAHVNAFVRPRDEPYWRKRLRTRGVKHEEKVVQPTDVNSCLRPSKEEPPKKKRLKSMLPTEQLNQENLIPDYQTPAQENWINTALMNVNPTPMVDMYGQVMQPQCYVEEFTYNKYGEVVQANNNNMVAPQNNMLWQQPSYPEQPDYMCGPLRQRYAHRNERRHNPYFQ